MEIYTIRKNINGDISNEEIENLLKPFSDNYNKYLKSYIMHEVIAYYIANSYYRHSMYKGSFLQHYNSTIDIINYFEKMMNLFINFKKDKVKETTFYNYGNKKLYLEHLYKIKLKDFNIN